MKANPELFEYIGFFEAEPEVLDNAVGWTCGARFSSTRGADRIVAVIAPDDGEFSLKWWRAENLCANLEMRGVVKWKLECDSSKESLSLGFSQPAIKRFVLQLKPHVRVDWYVEWDPAA